MSNIVFFRSDYKFVPGIAKVLDEKTGKIKQRIFIALKNKKVGHSIASPLTSFAGYCKGRKPSTQFRYMTILCHLFNYLYFERKLISDITELNSTMVADFINEYGRTHTRADTKDHDRIIKKSIFYVIQNYPGIIKNIDVSDFYISGKTITWSELESTVILPSASTDMQRKQNKTTDLDFEEVVRLLEICNDQFPNCAFGLYLAMFGGLRLSEVTHVTAEDIPIVSSGRPVFSMRINDKILSLRTRYSDIYQSKINRTQIVYIVREIFEPLYTQFCKSIKSGPIIINRNGEPMSARGFAKDFATCKKILIKELKAGDSANAMRAYELEHTTWGTHIGRGVFSNLIAKYSDQPYILALARGDKSYTSSMPYLVTNEKTTNKIQELLEKMYEELPRKCDEKKNT